LNSEAKTKSFEWKSGRKEIDCDMEIYILIKSIQKKKKIIQNKCGGID
jgi:hypothetical protein